MRSLVGVKDMVLGERFDDRVEVAAWADSVECLKFDAFFGQEINRVQ